MVIVVLALSVGLNAKRAQRQMLNAIKFRMPQYGERIYFLLDDRKNGCENL
jgi:hypothetical protein